MPRRTDSRSRMIHAAAELFRQHGYHATTFSDVVRDSGAPRGSTYFHFPGGKAELAREAIARAGDEVEEMVSQAARHAGDPASLVRALAQILASRLERSGYQSGCAIATMVLELAPRDEEDRKSTRLNSSHGYISYAVFCLKKKKNEYIKLRKEKKEVLKKLGEN